MHTANEPGAFRAIVQPQPRYKAARSSVIIRNTPRPRNASGLTCILILRTSRGSRTLCDMTLFVSLSVVWWRDSQLLRYPLIYRETISYMSIYLKGESSRSCTSLDHHFPFPFTERIRELRLIMGGDEIVEYGLTTKFVYPLCNFVSCCIS